MNPSLSTSAFSSPNPPFALVNGRIVTSTEVKIGQALVVDEGRIAAITERPGEGVHRVDVGERLITPGLIDIHTHGASGHTFNEPTATAFTAITQANARCGVTSLLAMTLTDAIDNLVTVLDFTAAWMNEHAHLPGGGKAQILGVHVEGPYFAMSQRGAQDPLHIR